MTDNTHSNSLSPSCDDYTVVKEGSVHIRFPKGEVFYNPVQQFNRDLSISVIRTFSDIYLSERKKRNLDGLTILEALSATGLRSIRYAKELPKIVRIYANDLDPSAVETIKRNVKLNSEDASHIINIIQPIQGDANASMHRLKYEGQQLDVIDLDPYGSAAPFIDSAVQSIADGGLLCVTCTDLAVLCATHPETCFAKYGGLPVRGDVCHEASHSNSSAILNAGYAVSGSHCEPLAIKTTAPVSLLWKIMQVMVQRRLFLK
ncbi:hypothetical protein PSACC_02927 [Paramicrosporidium saccamoebae]|uniref:tRNA (guanine(26)-N(2))-dimethyltransferase n=1 Tax=Paramicrosporidium saccamoebae TaxID=1246581 RepID=A0A2H9THP1_9FUNG|nr:hypothetical protein PSACC_02927 [Paramicrosporidium saccamoebae]